MKKNNKIIIQSGSIEDAIFVHNQIPEFNKSKSKIFETRIENYKSVIHIAYQGEIRIGYIVSYDRYNDKSIYCWMAGVIPENRKLKAFTLMMKKLEEWSAKNEFETIKIKTSNKRKAMLNYLVKNDFLITKVYNETKQKNIIDNRIDLEKKLK